MSFSRGIVDSRVVSEHRRAGYCDIYSASFARIAEPGGCVALVLFVQDDVLYFAHIVIDRVSAHLTAISTIASAGRDYPLTETGSKVGRILIDDR